MTPTITPGTPDNHEGLWVGSLKPTPTHSPRDDPRAAARLWLRRAKTNPATLDALRGADTWSCRDTDVPFWQAVSVELAGSNGNAPAPAVTQETPTDKPTGGLSKISNPIPEQLRECRFVLVGANSKRAIEPNWQNSRNYAYDDPHLLQHIAGGGNYGVMVSGGICVLDADDPQALAETGALTPLLGTYTVRTGRDGGGAHLYFRCPELPPEKFVLTNPDTGANLGDLRGSGSPFYVVGPGSTHPDTGRPYEPVDPDAEIVSIPMETVQEIIGSLKKPEPAKPVERPKPSVRGRSISDELNLRPEHFLMPENARQRDGEIEGTHPIHGSSTGSNLTISPNGTWYCRRCQSGGGALEALAVADGIIDCADARSGCLEGHWDAVMTALDKRGYGDQLREKRMEKVVEANAYEIDLGIPLPTPIVPPSNRPFDCSDEGNGDRLITQYGRDLVYSVAEKRWYIWDGVRWMRDETLMIHALAKRVSRTIYIEAANSISDNDRARLGKWAATSSMQPRIKAMIDSAAPLRAVRPDDLDTHEWYLNCRNGTLELDTCKFREANRDDLLTKCTGVVFDKYAECPQWAAHLDTIFDGDTSYIQTFQEFCGYCLLQYNPEQIMAIFYGVGKNGKSVTLATVARVLGDYAVNLPADSLAVKRSDNPDAARSDLAVLKGARLAWAVEGESGAVMAESMIKTMTGDDKVRVRRQYEHGFEFRPGAKIVLATNHEPIIKGTDAAIWRRIWLFPFTVVIKEEDRDPHIMEKLLDEGSGILNWMLIGLKRYLDRGRLIPADKVVAATRRYRTDQDRIGQFIREKMKVDSGADGYIPRPRFYALYKQWCDDEGERPRSSKAIAAYLRERGFLERKVGSERCWIGIRVKTVIEEREDDEDGSTQEVI